MSTPAAILEAVIGVAIQIHRELGPGLLESAHQRIVRDELGAMGLAVETEVNVPVVYREREYANSFRADLVVERSVVVEVKSTERIARVHSRRLLTYRRCLNLRHGLLLNFGMARAIDGIDRIVNYRIRP